MGVEIVIAPYGCPSLEKQKNHEAEIKTLNVNKTNMIQVCFLVSYRFDFEILNKYLNRT